MLQLKTWSLILLAAGLWLSAFVVSAYALGPVLFDTVPKYSASVILLWLVTFVINQIALHKTIIALKYSLASYLLKSMAKDEDEDKG